MSAEAELAKMRNIFPPAVDEPLHLRALSYKGRQVSLRPQNLMFTPADYPLVEDRWEAMSAAALMLNDEGYNIYTCVNPIKPDHVKSTVEDPDIACRRRLLIDIDRAEKLVAPATADDIEHAERVADRITARLQAVTGATVFRVMSGNGVHVYLPLDDLPNDSNSKHYCARLLGGLAAEFDDGVVNIDRTVSNASRITKVPGTIMRKGTETPERPYRMARVT